jgi:hypothetical protein
VGNRLAQQRLGALPFPQVRCRDKHSQNQALGVYHEVALTAFDLYVAVVTEGILTGLPPFSVVFTDWLAIMAAEGVGSRASDLRTWSRKASWIWTSSPLLLQSRK